MDLMKEIKLIQEYFANISEEDLEEKLIALGSEEIKSLDNIGMNFVAEKEIFESITYSNKRGSYYNVDPNSTTYNVNSNLLNEVA